jgi:hypothetical protein
MEAKTIYNLSSRLLLGVGISVCIAVWSGFQFGRGWVCFGLLTLLRSLPLQCVLAGVCLAVGFLLSLVGPFKLGNSFFFTVGLVGILNCSIPMDVGIYRDIVELSRDCWSGPVQMVRIFSAA